jgi:hypothetical protein
MHQVAKSKNAEEILLSEPPEVALMALDISIRICLGGKGTAGQKKELERLKALDSFMSIWTKLGKTEQDLDKYINGGNGNGTV